MSGYGQFCPVAQALEIVGERWTLLVVRELLCGNYRFNEILHGVPLMSRSLLSQRLKTLEDAGLIERRMRAGSNTYEYHLTAPGRELQAIVFGLGTWGQRWARRKADEAELDPVLLMWDMRRNLDLARAPAGSTVVMFWFRDLASQRSRYWLRLEDRKAELCLTNPGFDVDLTVETTLPTMVDVWMGDRKVTEEIERGSIKLEGTPHLTRNFPSWLMLSPFAKVERARDRPAATATPPEPKPKRRAARA